MCSISFKRPWITITCIALAHCFESKYITISFAVMPRLGIRNKRKGAEKQSICSSLMCDKTFLLGLFPVVTTFKIRFSSVNVVLFSLWFATGVQRPIGLARVLFSRTGHQISLFLLHIDTSLKYMNFNYLSMFVFKLSCTCTSLGTGTNMLLLVQVMADNW